MAVTLLEIAEKSARTSKRQPVPVDADIYETLRTYSKITGVPIARVVDQALRLHIETVITTRLETLQKYAAGDRAIPVADIPILPSAKYTLNDAMSTATVLDAPAPLQN